MEHLKEMGDAIRAIENAAEMMNHNRTMLLNKAWGEYERCCDALQTILGWVSSETSEHDWQFSDLWRQASMMRSVIDTLRYLGFITRREVMDANEVIETIRIAIDKRKAAQ
jgi:hypothetical protein